MEEEEYRKRDKIEVTKNARLSVASQLHGIPAAAAGGFSLVTIICRTINLKPQPRHHGFPDNENKEAGTLEPPPAGDIRGEWILVWTLGGLG